VARGEDGKWERVTGNDDETARAVRLRRAVAGITGFDLRVQNNGRFQLVWMSQLTGDQNPLKKTWRRKT
jgi:hypothetical protein